MSSPWYDNQFCVLCAAGEHGPEAHETQSMLTVTGHPTRKGRFLGIQDGARVVVLAKFDSDEAANLFLDWIRNRDGKRIEFRTEEGKAGEQGS